MPSSDESRYSRQIRFAPVGEAGQLAIGKSRALICGCGALGSTIAERLARAGVGHLRIVDRDWVEVSNLQRQGLFTEEDAASRQPKAVAAARELARYNSHITLEPIVEDVTYANIANLAADCDILLDGTDNFETRFLLNDFCIQQGVPWIHGGCLGASGQVLSIVPGATACFRCLLPELPSRDALETCDSAGVLGTAVGLIACWQATEALKVLSGNASAVSRGLIVLDAWDTSARIVRLEPNAHCPTCQAREFPFLSGQIRTETTVLCGKNAVQIESPTLNRSPLATIAERLQLVGPVTQNAFFVRLTLRDHTLTIFKGGRTVVEGTTQGAEAKSILAQTLGS